jgi:hypothetical protein
MKNQILILALVFTLGATSAQAQSAADCMHALRQGDNLGYWKSNGKLHQSSVVSALPVNTNDGKHMNVGWLYIDQWGLEWIQLNANATASTRSWFKVDESQGISGIYATVYPKLLPSWLTVESCK